MARSAAVTAVSSWLAGEARAMAPDVAITVAPMPADTSTFTAERTERIPGRFLFVGRLNAQKGIAELIDALAWTPAHCSLDIVGDGEDREALRTKIDQLGLAARVHWHGNIERSALAALYRRAIATVMPSRSEGLGLVAVESQLCGTPVIAYASGGLTDIVSPAHGGVLVPTGDTRALADAMSAHAATPGLAEAHRSAARATMLDRFAPASVAAGYRALYHSLLHDHEDHPS
jgi:glycosyltransferase involved in cell wall biosynthesis